MSKLSIAPSPFDQDSADLIFRTSDHVAYHVHSVILIQSSAFFCTMFSLPQPHTSITTPQSSLLPSQRPPIPTIAVDESSETLNTLLTIIYPIPKPPTRTFSLLEPALIAAEKYDMELVVDILKEDLRAATLDPVVGPLRVWATACRLHFEDIAQHAAALLNFSQLNQLNDESLLRGITAGQYFRLREFCRQHTEVPYGGFEFRLLNAPGTCGRLMHGAPHSSPQSELEAVPFSVTVPFPDVVVRSSDGVETPAHRCILAMASPILRKKLSTLPCHDACVGNTEGGTLPVLQLEEPNELLRNLLDSCCYFRAQYLDVDLHQLALIIGVAKKYEMEGGLQALREKWAQLVEHSTGNPLVAYLVAASAGPCMGKHANEAATLILCHSNSILTQYHPEMENVPALAYHRLLVYYEGCNAAITTEIEQVMMEYPSLVRWRRPRSQSLSSHGVAATPSSDYEWESPRLIGEDQWPLHLFLDGIARSSTRGPQRKIDTVQCDAILREYMSWASTELPDRPRAHAKELFDVALRLSNRLMVAMKQVCPNHLEMLRNDNNVTRRWIYPFKNHDNLSQLV